MFFKEILVEMSEGYLSRGLPFWFAVYKTEMRDFWQVLFPVPGLELKVDCCRLRNKRMGEEETELFLTKLVQGRQKGLLIKGRYSDWELSIFKFLWKIARRRRGRKYRREGLVLMMEVPEETRWNGHQNTGRDTSLQEEVPSWWEVKWQGKIQM